MDISLNLKFKLIEISITNFQKISVTTLKLEFHTNH